MVVHKRNEDSYIDKKLSGVLHRIQSLIGNSLETFFFQNNVRRCESKDSHECIYGNQNNSVLQP